MNFYIPDDQFTQAVIFLLVLFGLVGLLLPDYFDRLSWFPFLMRRRDSRPRPAPDARSRRRARMWGAISILGALFLLGTAG